MSSPLELRLVDWHDPRAVELREAMDVEMGALYSDAADNLPPEMIALIAPALTVNPDDIVATVVVVDGEDFVAHAALRPFENKLEVKRVFVAPSHRGRGLSKRLMARLEELALDRGVHELVLQTGDRQLEAIALYEGIGYKAIPLFGKYVGVDFFLCFGKVLA